MTFCAGMRNQADYETPDAVQHKGHADTDNDPLCFHVWAPLGITGQCEPSRPGRDGESENPKGCELNFLFHVQSWDVN